MENNVYPWFDCGNFLGSGPIIIWVYKLVYQLSIYLSGYLCISIYRYNTFYVWNFFKVKMLSYVTLVVYFFLILKGFKVKSIFIISFSIASYLQELRQSLQQSKTNENKQFKQFHGSIVNKALHWHLCI